MTNTCHKLIEHGKPNVRSALVSAIRNNGYAVIKDCFPEGLIQTVAAELRPYFDGYPNCEGHFFGFSTIRFGGVFAKSPTTRQIAIDPDLISLIEEILSPHCERIQINLTQAISILPGERRQVPHKDDELFPWPHPGAEFMVNVMLPLTKYTPENGSTMLWPKSHLGAVTREPDFGEATSFEMMPGDALVYSGNTLHCGGANRTPQPRNGLVISYSLGWLRQAENQYLAYPPNTARGFSKELQALIGYKIHRPNLGWHEGQDPSSALRCHKGLAPTRDLLPPEAEQILEQIYG